MYYSIRNVAMIFDKNPETIRRWIRTGKLKAEPIESRKNGYRISEKELNAFKDRYYSCETNSIDIANVDSETYELVCKEIENIEASLKRIKELLNI